MSKKQQNANENQTSLNFEAEDTPKAKSKEQNVINEENDTDEEKVSLKKIDNYIPPVSPVLEEMNALSQLFSNFAKLPAATVSDIPISTQDQINVPVAKKGYELVFDYDRNNETERLHKKMKAIVKAIGGSVAEPSIYDDSCSISVQLPLNLEEATAFFDKYLKVQFSENIKMSGTIYKDGYAFTATADESKISEIKESWVRFSNGGKCRELFQNTNHLTMIFQDEEDFIKNSAILGLSGTEKDGVKFTTDIEAIRIKEAVNYNPKRALSPD